MDMKILVRNARLITAGVRLEMYTKSPACQRLDFHIRKPESMTPQEC